MRIEIFDVELGQCIWITADDGSVMLIDCGHNATTGWRPSGLLAARQVNWLSQLTISNCDEDHASDLYQLLLHLVNLDGSLRIGYLGHNTTITPAVIRAMKDGEPGLGVRSVIHLCEKFNVPVLSGIPPIGNITRRLYFNRYPDHFANPALNGFSNNLSLVTFLHYRDIHMIIPGDLEEVGWQRLLRDPNFVADLRTVNVFVAPHHGRQSGYNAEVFRHCRPKIIIISDDRVQYDTQTGIYDDTEAAGVLMFDRQRPGLLNSQNRYVLTTRCDTTAEHPVITIEQPPNGVAQISTAYEYGFL
jgi:hypothetical protein